MVSNLFLVRHGAAQQDTGLVYNVLPGPPLAEQGWAEAERAAAFLVGQCLRCKGSAFRPRSPGRWP